MGSSQHVLWHGVLLMLLLCMVLAAEYPCTFEDYDLSAMYRDSKQSDFKYTVPGEEFYINICGDTKEQCSNAGACQKSDQWYNCGHADGGVFAEYPGGDEGVQLTYGGGDQCNGVARTTKMDIKCDPNADAGEIREIDESVQCRFAVSMASKYACREAPSPPSPPRPHTALTTKFLTFAVSGAATVSSTDGDEQKSLSVESTGSYALDGASGCGRADVSSQRFINGDQVGAYLDRYLDVLDDDECDHTEVHRHDDECEMYDSNNRSGTLCANTWLRVLYEVLRAKSGGYVLNSFRDVSTHTETVGTFEGTEVMMRAVSNGTIEGDCGFDEDNGKCVGEFASVFTYVPGLTMPLAFALDTNVTYQGPLVEDSVIRVQWKLLAEDAGTKLPPFMIGRVCDSISCNKKRESVVVNDAPRDLSQEKLVQNLFSLIAWDY